MFIQVTKTSAIVKHTIHYDTIFDFDTETLFWALFLEADLDFLGLFWALDIKFRYEIYLTEKSLQHCRFAMTEHCFIGFAISQ
jgi:hypothetical protein